MSGFYRNKYTTPDGSEVRYGASTQFEVINEFYFYFNFICFGCSSQLIVDEHFHVGMSQILKLHLI
jgi:hypothetical protein